MPGANASVNLAGYVNPLEHAHVTAERIDQGVDYAGTGSFVAIGDGIVTQVTQAGDTGWTSAHPGGFVEYQIQGGGLNGLYIYHAEG
ncbi:MAG TPA: hypothetical protein VG348_15930, partial [Acidimicrobiia bacterium]|nr:hypothetical protein [Acidimicrobiia bacterium]